MSENREYGVVLWAGTGFERLIMVNILFYGEDTSRLQFEIT